MLSTRPTFLRSSIIAATLLFTSAVYAQAEPVIVTSPISLAMAVKAAKPGETIVIADGTYTNFDAVLNGMGEKDKPITIRAQNPGKVTLTGFSSILLDGDWMVLSGLVFKDGAPVIPEDPRDAGAYAIKLLGNNNRATENAIINFSVGFKSKPGQDTNKIDYHKWVIIGGTHHRVDHNLFQGKTGGGTLLTVDRRDATPDFHQIDHNAFIDFKWGSDANGWETIRLGDSKQSQSDSKSVVEFNYFENADGEIEIISNKSGGNTYRNNTFRNSRGQLTLRHGNGMLVENNVFFVGKDKDGGGIRVMDKDHVIRNNYVIGAHGQSEHWGGIVLMAYDENAKLNGYWPVDNTLIENNTVINSMHSFAINSGRGKLSSISATVKNNVFCTKRDSSVDYPLIVSAKHKKGEMKVNFDGNVFCGSALGLDSAGTGSNVVSDAGLDKKGDFWLMGDAKKGFQPIKVTKREDTGPTTFKP